MAVKAGEAYTLARYGTGVRTKPMLLRDLLALLRKRLQGGVKGPYSIRPNDGDFGPARDLKETLSRLEVILRTAETGSAEIVRGADDADPKEAVRKVFVTEGPVVLKLAASQIGVPYIWADEDPAGGGSAGFDCSGLVKWCYHGVDIEFPHSADAIMHDGQVTLFKDRSKLVPGDIIFYCYGRLGAGHADHIGLFAGNGTQIDASSSAAHVVRQGVDWDHVLNYGYVREVTGAH